MTLIWESSCAAVSVGLSQWIHSPTVPAVRDTQSYGRVTSVPSRRPCFTGQREKNPSQSLQAVQVEGWWMSTEAAQEEFNAPEQT
ncbi:uncharacterized protein V6R79_022027 [Siganus canaliculatus]